MDIETFEKTRWKAHMKALYRNKKHIIASVDFAENLVGLEINEMPDDINWVRCENIELIES